MFLLRLLLNIFLWVLEIFLLVEGFLFKKIYLSNTLVLLQLSFFCCENLVVDVSYLNIVIYKALVFNCYYFICFSLLSKAKKKRPYK